ncbi:uncharacterized protein [Pyrus communis]|uniref:uncharacterized protein n=1 Tax=Pyrus communis TaxID=23211 RepID=UPI0035C02E3B
MGKMALPIKVSSSSSQALPVHQQFPELPKAQEPVQSLSDISPSSSLKGKPSKSSSSKKKEDSDKSSQLLDLAQQLMAEAARLQKKKGSDSDSDASDAGSQPPANWADQVDLQDAQDPTRWVKWWDKFNHQKIIDLVKVEFPQASFQALPIKVSSSSSQALPVHQQFPELPKAQEPVQSLSDISPSSSLKGKPSKSSSSKKKEDSDKSSQLLDLAQQLMAEAARLQKKKGSDSDSDASDAGSQPPANWADQVDLQDAQDPFDY